jgi:hypothetical protein
MDLLTEQAIAALAGDEKALEYVAKETFAKAYSFSLKLLKNVDDARMLLKKFLRKVVIF